MLLYDEIHKIIKKHDELIGKDAERLSGVLAFEISSLAMDYAQRTVQDAFEKVYPKHKKGE